MVYQMFRRTTIKWFGGYDYYRINYMLYVLGIAWALRREYFLHSKLKMRLFELQKKMMFLMSSIVSFNMVTDGYLVWNDPEQLNYSMSTSFFFMGSMCHFASLINGQKDLESSLDLLNNDFYLKTIGRSRAERDILDGGEKQLKKLSKLFYFFAVLGLVSRIVCHLAPSEKMMLLPFPYSDKLVTPFFEIMFFLQLFGMVHFLITLIASEMVVLGFMIRIIKHFEVLTHNITQIKKLYLGTDALFELDLSDKENGKGNLVISNVDRVETMKSRVSQSSADFKELKWQKERVQNSIRNAIIHHQEILKVTSRMNRVLGATFFLQIFGGGILLGILCIDLILKSKTLSMKIIAQSVYAGAFLLNTSILCFFGSKIEAKSHKAAESLYGIPWPEMDAENRKTLAFFLDGLWKHPVLRAGHHVPVNLITYVKFLHLIYNCVGFMQNSVNYNN